LLGILWEVWLGQPALASFLDQNWLEGLDRSAPAYFTAVLGELQRRRLSALDPRSAPPIRSRSPDVPGKSAAARGRATD
jgi:hypothetical protein